MDVEREWITIQDVCRQRKSIRLSETIRSQLIQLRKSVPVIIQEEVQDIDYISRRIWHIVQITNMTSTYIRSLLSNIRWNLSSMTSWLWFLSPNIDEIKNLIDKSWTSLRLIVSVNLIPFAELVN